MDKLSAVRRPEATDAPPLPSAIPWRHWRGGGGGGGDLPLSVIPPGPLTYFVNFSLLFFPPLFAQHLPADPQALLELGIRLISKAFEAQARPLPLKLQAPGDGGGMEPVKRGR